MQKSILFILSLFILFSLSNCGGKKGEPVNDSKSELKFDKEEIEQKVHDVVYPLPTSFEVSEMINSIEASYILDLINPVTNVDKYFTAKDQAINLGIYGADLSYASTYNMKQDVMNLMEVSEQLIKELNITGAFSQEFLNEVEANIDNREVLTNLITNSFYGTYEYLVKNSKEDLSLLVLVGSWVEAMYISCNISETVFQNPELIKIILHQKSSLSKLVDLLTPHYQHESIRDILSELKAIKEVYDSIEETAITEEQLNQVIEQVIKLRKEFTS